MAATAVVFAHTTGELDNFGLDKYVYGTYSNGNPMTTLLSIYGVSIFFALSGFLITFLLLEEKRLEEVNIKNFYIRRILRIWPLYYLYLVLAIITAVIYDIPFNKESVLFYIFLAANVPYVFGGGFNLIGHYWSLGVEEQFYSFWPWIIKKSKSVLKITVLVFLGLILFKTILRITDICLHDGAMSLTYQFVYVSRFQCMIIGAIGAILYFNKNKLFIRICNNYITQSIVWFAIFMTAINKFHIISYLDNEIISLITVFLIMGQILKSKRIVNLDLPFIDFIGKISYGIYILHPLVIFYLSKIIFFSEKNFFNYVIIYIVVFLSTVLLSHISYEYFEKRFLSMKKRYSTIPSSDARLPQPAQDSR